MAHTESPWKIDSRFFKDGEAAGNSFFWIINEKGAIAAKTDSLDNAWLIAAAPDLLAACKEVINWVCGKSMLSDGREYHDFPHSVEVAIDKAEGKV